MSAARSHIVGLGGEECVELVLEIVVRDDRRLQYELNEHPRSKSPFICNRDTSAKSGGLSGAAAPAKGAEEKVAAPTEEARDPITALQQELQEERARSAGERARSAEERARSAALEARLAAAERRLGPSSEVVPAQAISAAQASVANQKAAGRPCCSV